MCADIWHFLTMVSMSATTTTTTDQDQTDGGGGGGATQRPSSRPLFHYFYGSIGGSGGGGGTNPSTTTHPSLNTSLEADEKDSLVGEELADNEGGLSEQDAVGKGEYGRLLSSNGGLPHHRHVVKNTAEQSPQQRNRWCGIWTILLVLFVAGTLTALGIVFFLPHNMDGTSAALSFPTVFFTIPFPEVDRSEFRDPVDNFIDTSLFHPSLLNTKDSPQAFQFPFPTGAFWTNLIVYSPQGDISYPVAVYPYAYRWSPTSLQVSYPAAHRVMDSRIITDSFAPELTIQTKEKIANRYVTAFDPLSVTLRFVTNANSKWETALVQGSPYVTLQYLSQTPVFRPLSIFSSMQCPGDEEENFSDMLDDVSSSSSSAATASSPKKGAGGFERRRRTTRTTINQYDQVNDYDYERRRLFGVCSIDDSDSQVNQMRGVQFIFKTPEGKNWIMFSSEPMNLVFDKIRKTTIISAEPFTGIIRLAYIPAGGESGMLSDGEEKTFDSSTGLRRLIYHADSYPVGGQVSFEFHDATTTSSVDPKISSFDQSSRYGTVSFSFATRSMMGSLVTPTVPASNLLMLALPHHAELLSSSVKLSEKKFDLSYTCIKGNMTAVVGSTWSYEEALFDLEFDGPAQPLDDGVHDLILKQIEDDLTRVLPTFSENVYGYGKQVARIAQLAHVADQIEPKAIGDQKGNATAGADDNSVLGKATTLLSMYLESFLSSKVSDSLLFDSSMGGLVSTNGLRDEGEDFGNGRYNDHHFHYG